MTYQNVITGVRTHLIPLVWLYHCSPETSLQYLPYVDDVMLLTGARSHD